MIDGPYIGLRAFDTKDANLFFGRTRLVGGLMARLRGTRFVGVLGLSGGGKSSLVRAGLLPALQAGYLDWNGAGWDIEKMRPDINPLEELAKALARTEWGAQFLAGRSWEVLAEELREGPYSLASLFAANPTRKKNTPRLLIVVDQFEEVFTRDGDRDDPAIRRDTARFVEILLDATTRTDQIYVVATMRSDHIGDCAEYSDLAEAMTRGVFLVTRMRPKELADAIEIPARINDGAIEPDLRDYLVQSWNGTSDLPILQHALMRMWQDASENPDGSGKITITSKNFFRCGTDRGESLDRHLNEVYEGLGSDLWPVAEAIFRRITGQGAKGYVRQPASVKQILQVGSLTEREALAMPLWRRRHVQELAAPLNFSNIKQVVKHFRDTGAFLQISKTTSDGEPTNESVIDLAHEAVINHWKTAKLWAEYEKEAARRLNEICERAGRQESDGLLSDRADFNRYQEWFLRTTLWEGGPQLSPQWARRYRPYEDFQKANEFLDKSRAELDQRDLREALTGGDLDKADQLIERGVRLAIGQHFDLMPQYFAMAPAEIRRHHSGRESAQRQTETSQQEGAVSATDVELTAEELTFAFEGWKDRPGARGLSPAHYAAYGGSPDVLKYLDTRGFNFDTRSTDEHTPFHMATLNAELEAAKWLHTKIGNQSRTVHCADKDGNSSLILAIARARAAFYGPIEPARHKMIEWLLENGAKLEARNQKGETPLHTAARQGGPEIVGLLLDRVSSLEARRAMLASTENEEGWTALHVAAHRSRPYEPSRSAAAAALLKGGAEINARDKSERTPLILAARSNDLSMVRLLLDYPSPADHSLADIYGVTPVLACLRSQLGLAFPVLEALIKKSADVNAVSSSTGETALHIAIEIERPERDLLVQMLLKANAFVDVRDYSGRTPIELALSKRQVPNATKCFKEGKRRRDDDTTNQDWLIAASSAGAPELVGLLLQTNARADARSETGATALHAAAEAGQWSVLEVLSSQAGANLEVEDANGLTPLRAALFGGNLLSAERLHASKARMPHGLILDTRGARPEVRQDKEGLPQSLRQQIVKHAGEPWPFAPLMQGAWSILDADAASDLLLSFGVRFLSRIRVEEVAAVRRMPLTFLKEGTLYEVRMVRDGANIGYFSFMSHARGITYVDGSSPTADADFVGAFSVDDVATAQDYLRYYCGAWAIDLGVLTPIEKPGDGLLNVPSPSQEARAKVDQAATPIKLEQKEDVWTGRFVAQYGPDIWVLDVLSIGANADFKLRGNPSQEGILPYRRSYYSSGLRVVIED